jgi:hypothetical protein
VSIKSEVLSLMDGGRVTAAAIVEHARTNPKSALHKALEWDDAKAAQLYRVVQVDTLMDAIPEFGWLPEKAVRS